MKTLLLGVGRQGARILQLLIERSFSVVHIYDVRKEVLQDLKKQYQDKVEIVTTNMFSIGESEAIDFLKEYNYIVDALPAEFSYKLFKFGAKAGSKIVSVSFLEEDFMELDQLAKEHESVIVPDCGVAPGFSHLLAGYSVHKLEGADNVIMKLGAIPKTPVAPFNHNFTWSVENLVEEYVRPAKIREDGSLKAVDPFEGILKEEILGHRLESFVTDGARSFLTSFPEVKDMEERTLRHPGHLDYMRAFKSAGLLSAEPVWVGDHSSVPYKYLAHVLEQTFSNLPIEDMFVMEVVAKNSQRASSNVLIHKYVMEYDHDNNVPALVNAVAITAVETLQLLHDGKIKEKGVLPLELVASETVYDALVAAHRALGAQVEVQMK